MRINEIRSHYTVSTSIPKTIYKHMLSLSDIKKETNKQQTKHNIIKCKETAIMAYAVYSQLMLDKPYLSAICSSRPPTGA